MISSLETSEHITIGDFEVKKHTVEYVASLLYCKVVFSETKALS